MIVGPFLTDIDPQAAVKGSRDPLGVQTIWSRLGRHVVGNLTTVTTSVRDFTTLMLGYYFAERVADSGGSDGDLNVFLRWEQLAGHARFRVNNDARIRGIDRIKKAKNDGGRIRICADATGQILSNQRTYGLWGLYTGAARASGLIDGEPTRLTAAGRDLVQTAYVGAFTANGLRNADAVVHRLSQSKLNLDADGKDSGFLRGVGKVLVPRLAASERKFFREHLLLGEAIEKTTGKQAALATAIDGTLGNDDWTWSPASVGHLAKACRKLGEVGGDASRRLERIRSAEQLLAPSDVLFDLVLGSGDQRISEVASGVQSVWGQRVSTIDVSAIRQLEVELRDSKDDPQTGARWVQTAEALASGSYGTAIKLLIEQNASVMRMRGGAGAWVDSSGARLKIRYRDENLRDLPERGDLPKLWRHSYFIDALRAIALELRS